MNDNEGRFSFIGTDGKRVEAKLSTADYKAAASKGISLAQHLEQTHGMKTDTALHGTVLQQMMQSAGMFLNADSHTGLKPPSMADVLNGTTAFNMGAITRPEDNVGAGARLLFPEVVMQVIESELRSDHGDFLGSYNNMIAQTQTISGPKFEQPIVDITAPAASSNQPVSQLAEPAIMVGITTSDVSRKISTKSIGLMISDEALQATSLDLVNLIIGAQSRQERVNMVEADISAMVDGDVDRNETALGSVLGTSFDSAATGGTMTHKAWVKYLRANYRKMGIDYILADIDTALAIESRTNKPIAGTSTGDQTPNPFAATYSIENLGVTEPKILLVDTEIIGASTVVGIDSRVAIRRVINASAAYSAIEQFVLRKAQAMRFDYGEMSHKMYTDGWSKMTFA